MGLCEGGEGSGDGWLGNLGPLFQQAAMLTAMMTNQSMWSETHISQPHKRLASAAWDEASDLHSRYEPGSLVVVILPGCVTSCAL